MNARIDAERKWSVLLPQRLDSFTNESRDACQMIDGEIVPLPSPPLSFEAIAQTRLVAEDWKIPTGLVPIMGDFHDLVCLDYRRSSQAAVVLLDDERNERALFDSFDGFLDALCTAPASTGSVDGIIEEESWLDF